MASQKNISSNSLWDDIKLLALSQPDNQRLELSHKVKSQILGIVWQDDNEAE